LFFGLAFFIVTMKKMIYEENNGFILYSMQLKY